MWGQVRRVFQTLPKLRQGLKEGQSVVLTKGKRVFKEWVHSGLQIGVNQRAKRGCSQGKTERL